MKKVVGPIAASILILWAIFLVVYPKKTKPETDTRLPSTTSLSYPAQWNYRQSRNACGPYSVAATLCILTKNEISSDKISEETPWRYRRYTLPFGMVSVLKKHHVTNKEYLVQLLDKEKLT